MTGVVNQTGARSGIVGTNVGTVGAADLSGVLPVGVTGGSGLTALGTVVSGNISHADIVYPAGHVVYTQYKKCSAASGTTIDSTWKDVNTVFIDVPAATCDDLSSIYILISHQVLVYMGNSHHFCSTRIRRSAPSEVTDLGTHQSHGTNGTSHGATFPIYDGSMCIAQDSSLSNAEHTYYLQAYGETGYTSEINAAQHGANITILGVK